MKKFIGILIGLFVGAPIGMLTTALVTANSRTKEEDHYGRIKRQD